MSGGLINTCQLAEPLASFGVPAPSISSEASRQLGKVQASMGSALGRTSRPFVYPGSTSVPSTVIYAQLSLLQTVPDSVFLLHNPRRQALTNAKEHEQSPLPSEGIDRHAENKPIDQL